MKRYINNKKKHTVKTNWQKQKRRRHTVKTNLQKQKRRRHSLKQWQILYYDFKKSYILLTHHSTANDNLLWQLRIFAPLSFYLFCQIFQNLLCYYKIFGLLTPTSMFIILLHKVKKKKQYLTTLLIFFIGFLNNKRTNIKVWKI